MVCATIFHLDFHAAVAGGGAVVSFSNLFLDRPTFVTNTKIDSRQKHKKLEIVLFKACHFQGTNYGCSKTKRLPFPFKPFFFSSKISHLD